MNVLEKKIDLRPVNYPEFKEAYEKSLFSHWSHHELSIEPDILDWVDKLSMAEKSVIGNLFKAFTGAEGIIGCNWKRISQTVGQPEIVAMADMFSHEEAIHGYAYDFLEAHLPMDEVVTKDWHSDPVAQKKMETIMSFSDIENFITAVAVFAFVEGVSLYSSFATLMAFTKKGYLKSMYQVLLWSVLQECIVTGEVLTENGWKSVTDVDISNEKVAQYDINTGEISFDYPVDKIEKWYEGEIVNFKSDYHSIDITVTANHDMITKWNYQDNYSKQKAIDVNMNPKKWIPVAGHKNSGSISELSNLDRLRIAIQADGTVKRRSSVSDTVYFRLTKSRKKARLEYLLNSLNITYSVNKDSDEWRYYFTLPIENDALLAKHSFDWVDTTNITSGYAKEFINELFAWDGWKSKDSGNAIGYYCSTNRVAISKVQEIAVIAGYLAKPHWTSDNRKDSYKDCCNLTIEDRQYQSTGRLTKTISKYKGKVYCLTMPKGTLIHRGTPETTAIVIGNCNHSKMAIKLVKTMIAEGLGVLDKEKCYELAELIVKNEKEFVKNAFGDTPNLGFVSVDQSLSFIDHRGNLKLMELGLKPIFPYTKDYKPLANFFYTALEGKTVNDFFAVSRNGTGYSNTITQKFEDCYFGELNGLK